MNRDDVVDVLSVVAAATRRTVGETDVDVWQAIIGDDNRELALRAVRDHLADKPGVWLEPGHVHQRVRAMVRDQLEREPDAVREARQEALAAKAAEDIEALAERKGIQQLPTRPFLRPAGNRRRILSIACPWAACRAPIGRSCPVEGGAHPARIEAAQVTADDPEDS